MARTAPQGWLPRWVLGLGCPAWVVGPDRTVRWTNRSFRDLLGPGFDPLGHPCWRMIRGRDARGRVRCGPECAPLRDALLDRPVHPVLIAVGPASARWLHVLVIPLSGPDGSFPWLVHCAAGCAGPVGAERYFRGVARRSLPAAPDVRRAKLASLTAREREVVRLLCRGDTLHGIAAALGVRYVTVRNHVQHIEGKLGVHSLLEIVAVGLTPDPGPPRRRAPGGPAASRDARSPRLPGVDRPR